MNARSRRHRRFRFALLAFFVACLVLASGCCTAPKGWRPFWCKDERTPVKPAAQDPAARASGEARKLVPAVQSIKESVDEAGRGLDEVKARPEAAPVKEDLDAKVGVPLAAASTKAAAAVTDATEHAATAAQVEEAVGQDAETISELQGQVLTLTDEVARAKDDAEASALLWMMLLGGGLLVAGAVCAYLFKSGTIAVIGVIAGGGLILVSRLLSAVNHFIIDNPVLAGLIAVGVILAVIGVIGWRGGWFFKKVADQTIKGTNDLLPGKADPLKQNEMTTVLKAAQDLAVQKYIKKKVAILDKADAVKAAMKEI